MPGCEAIVLPRQDSNESTPQSRPLSAGSPLIPLVEYVARCDFALVDMSGRSDGVNQRWVVEPISLNSVAGETRDNTRSPQAGFITVTRGEEK